MNILYLMLLMCILTPQKLCGTYFKEYANYLGTKTPYRIVSNLNSSPIKFNGCRAVKTWMVIRHGTRYPSIEMINYMKINLTKIQEEIMNNLNNGGTTLDNEIIENLRNWKPTIIDDKDEKILVHEGEDEMVNLAERMSLRLPEVLPNIYSNTSYKFRFTATQRTNASALSFTTGLFGRTTSKDVWFPEPLTRDPILRFYTLCDKWKSRVKTNSSALYEQQLFKSNNVVVKTLLETSKILGLNRSLTFDEIHMMYMTCAFETSWHRHKISPWCNIFNKKSLQVMEYSEDLRYFWIDGYGFNLTYKQACPAIKNLVEYFKSTDVYPKAVLYFTHSGTMLKLYAHLGLYKDTAPLRHDNYEKQSKRLWRVSKIDPFASNLAFLLFECGEQKKILLLHQERIVRLPGCDNDLCSFDTFLNNFNDSFNNCQFSDMCHL